MILKSKYGFVIFCYDDDMGSDEGQASNKQQWAAKITQLPVLIGIQQICKF